MHRLRADFEEPLDYLETTLPTLVTFEPAPEVLTVSGVEAIRENSRFIVGGAREELYISIWLDDFGDLADELTIAHERGVRIFGMFYGDELPVGSGSWLTHGYRQIVSDRIGGRPLTPVGGRAEGPRAPHPPPRAPGAGRAPEPARAPLPPEDPPPHTPLQRAQN